MLTLPHLGDPNIFALHSSAPNMAVPHSTGKLLARSGRPRATLVPCPWTWATHRLALGSRIRNPVLSVPLLAVLLLPVRLLLLPIVRLRFRALAVIVANKAISGRNAVNVLLTRDVLNLVAVPMLCTRPKMTAQLRQKTER